MSGLHLHHCEEAGGESARLSPELVVARSDSHATLIRASDQHTGRRVASTFVQTTVPHDAAAYQAQIATNEAYAAELVRRWNTHEALADALRELLACCEYRPVNARGELGAPMLSTQGARERHALDHARAALKAAGCE